LGHWRQPRLGSGWRQQSACRPVQRPGLIVSVPSAGASAPLAPGPQRRSRGPPLRPTHPPNRNLAGRHGWAPGVALLLSGGAKPNHPNKRGLTALGEAVAGGHADVAKALIAGGADVRCSAGDG
jgi:hypothetical protein